MSERLQTVLVRRTTAKRRITNIVSRFSGVATDDNAHQTVQDLRIDMRNALETFRAVDDQLRPLLEAAEANALPTEKADHFAHSQSGHNRLRRVHHKSGIYTI